MHDTEVKTRTNLGEVTIQIHQDGTMVLFGKGIRQINAIQHFEYRGENNFDLHPTKETPVSDSLWFRILLNSDKVACTLHRNSSSPHRWSPGEEPAIHASVIPCRHADKGPCIVACVSVGSSFEKFLGARFLLLEEPDAKKAA